MNRSSSSLCVDDLNESLDSQQVDAKLVFAVQLKKAMDREGVNASELAKRLGVSRPMVSKLLSGEANVTIETMVKAAYHLSSRLYLNLADEQASAKFMSSYTNAEVVSTYGHRARGVPQGACKVPASVYAKVGKAGGDQADAA
jgi:transcriptional regulator with XRE-family HTH domain